MATLYTQQDKNMILKQFLTKYWYLTAGVVGVLSGVAVAALGTIPLGYFSGAGPILGNFLLLIPGAIFGIFSAGYFSLTLLLRPTLWRLSLWTIISSISYFAAFWGGLFIGGNNYSLLIGSIIGASVLAVAFHFLFQRFYAYLGIIFFSYGRVDRINC